VLATVQTVEIRSTVNTEQHGFTVQNEGANADAKSCLYDQRIAIRPIMAVPREQANALALPVDRKACCSSA
jgi:hypothetical protein